MFRIYIYRTNQRWIKKYFHRYTSKSRRTFLKTYLVPKNSVNYDELRVSLVLISRNIRAFIKKLLLNLNTILLVLLFVYFGVYLFENMSSIKM